MSNDRSVMAELWLATKTLSLASLVSLGVSGCVEAPEEATAATAATAVVDSVIQPRTDVNPASRTALFGELHVHTQYSFDAFIFGTRSTPDSAYEFAKGKPVKHPAGFEMRLREPLDFQSVTDHAMYMGMLPEMAKPDTTVGAHRISQGIREAKTAAQRLVAFQQMFPYLRQQLDGPCLLYTSDAADE